jgi:hypothetical protein
MHLKAPLNPVNHLHPMKHISPANSKKGLLDTKNIQEEVIAEPSNFSLPTLLAVPK